MSVHCVGSTLLIKSAFETVYSPVHTGDKVEFNTVVFVESRLCCRNRQQSRLLLIRSALLPILATYQQQLEFDSLSRSTLWLTRSTFLPIRSTLLPVCTVPKPHGGLSTKSTVLNLTLLPVCTGFYMLSSAV